MIGNAGLTLQNRLKETENGGSENEGSLSHQMNDFLICANTSTDFSVCVKFVMNVEPQCLEMCMLERLRLF